jgi:hypothetical protein
MLMTRYVEVNAKLIPYNKMVQKSNLIFTGLYALSIPLSFVWVYLPYVIFIEMPLWDFLSDKFHK